MIIAHDLGTTGDKASLHGDDGHLVSATTIPYSTHYGEHGIAEQDRLGIRDPRDAFEKLGRVVLVDRGDHNTTQHTGPEGGYPSRTILTPKYDSIAGCDAVAFKRSGKVPGGSGQCGI